MFIQEWGASRICFPIKSEGTSIGIFAVTLPDRYKSAEERTFLRSRNVFYSGINAIRSFCYESNKRALLVHVTFLQIIYLRYKCVVNGLRAIRATQKSRMC